MALPLVVEVKEVVMHGSRRDEEFSEFARANRVELLRSACLLTAGDVHRAEDLVQITLARMYVAWPRVSRSGNVLGYAWRVLVNAHIDETRRPWWRRERSVGELPDGPAIEVPADGPDGDAVRAALAGLPPRMRAAVVLRHWLDLSVGETATLLGCTEGTVKSQTAKAASRLRALLATATAQSAESQPPEQHAQTVTKGST
jgi:RNA polymerase sigma-70 factor (sigma-E family)